VPPHVAAPPYLSTDQLAQLTPWTIEAINTMRKRAVLKRGVHYFQPAGKHGQVIFKWAAVVELIEGSACSQRNVVDTPQSVIALANGKIIHVEEATERANRLLS
jgi:hypothetical protein